jgi:hypothetical protein
MGLPVATWDFWDQSREKWAATQLLLEDRVLEPLRHCWGVFLGTYASRFFNPTDISFIDEVTQEQTSAHLRSLNDLLAKFSKNPPEAGSEDWREFKRLRYYINRIFLETDGGNQKRKGSLLYQFLHGCPTDIMRMLKRKTASERWARSLAIEFKELAIQHLPVFCHDKLVDELLEEIYTNAISHKSNNFEGSVSVGIEVSHEQESNRITMRFKCRGTDPKRRDYAQPGEGGEGLIKLERALEPYGATIHHGAVPEEQWDYCTTVTFLYGGQ